LKVITEAMLRDTLKCDQPERYVIPEGMLLSPAAREYLQQRKIKIEKAGETKKIRMTISGEEPVNRDHVDLNVQRADVNEHGKHAEAKSEADAPKIVATEVPPMPTVELPADAPIQPKFVDYDTGALYMEKPEHMTHLYGNVLVPKNHPRILFRGKLDALQALVVLDQAIIAEDGGSQRLIDDLGNILGILREMMRCDVLEEDFKNEYIIGLNHEQLRERSHDPMKFYHIKQMVLPDYTMGKHYALINQLRTAVRETEEAAVTAFQQGTKYTRRDIVEELNRMSSALHIMMCMYLGGEYKS
jgi:ethanolamine utilization cobalamin adenosyltransferase